MLPDLRPLTLGELLDRAFSLYRRYFRTFVAIAAPPAAIGGVIAALFRVIALTSSGGAGRPPVAASAAAVLLPALSVLLLLVPSILVNAVAVAAMTGALADVYAGREPTARGAFERVRGRIGRVLLLVLLTGMRLLGVALATGICAAFILALASATARTLGILGTTLGIAAALVLALVGVAATIYLALRYSLSVPALVVEDVTAGEAIRRSIALSRGSMLRALVITVFGVVIGQIAALLLQGPFMIGVMVAGLDSAAARVFEVAGAFSGAAANAIAGPLMSLALGVLYYDTRVRHEALDLHMMLDALDSPAERVGLGPAPVFPR